MAKNWLDKFDNGGETPANYNSIPTGIVKPPTVIPTSGSSYYEPSEQTIYLNPTAYYKDPSVYQHEMFHHWQNLNDQLRKPDEYQGPLAKPNMLSNNTGDYYNRRTVETDKEYNDFYKDNPTFKVVNPNLIYNAVVNPSLYENPKYAEGEAEDYQNYIKSGGTPAFMAKGGLIKRADGSYSKRGLWDNIRANKGSGKKPTAEMLRQERKINKKEDGGWIDMYNDGSWVADSAIPTPTTPPYYPAGEDTTLTNYQMGTPKARMYAAGSTVWTKQDTPLWAAGTPTPTATQNFRNTGSLNTDLYRIGDVIPTGMDYKTPSAGTYDYNKDRQPPKKMVYHAPDTLRIGGIQSAKYGGPIMYGNGTKVYSTSNQNTNQVGTNYQNTFQEASTNIDPNGNTSQQFIRQTNNPNQTPYLRYFNDDALGSEMHIAGPNSNMFIKPDFIMDNFLKTRSNYTSGAMAGEQMKRNGGRINKYENAGPVINGNNPGGRTDLQYDAKTNAYYKPLEDGSLYPVSKVSFKNPDGTTQELWTDSDEYKQKYGNLMSYNPNTEIFQGKTFEPVEVTAQAPDTYNNYMLRKHKNDGLVGAMFGMPLDYVASFPQAAMTKAFTGKYQTPSEAMNIENPYLAGGVDMVSDPSNLLGIGLFDDVGRAYKYSKLIGNGFKEIGQHVAQNAVETGRGMYNTFSELPRKLIDMNSDIVNTVRPRVTPPKWSQVPIPVDNLPSSWASFYDHPDLTASSPHSTPSSTPPVYTPDQMNVMNLRDRLANGDVLSPEELNNIQYDKFNNARNFNFGSNGRISFDFENSNYIKPKVSISNRSGLTKEEALERAAVKDKDVISKMTEEEFANTVVKPNGEVVTYKSGPDINQVGYDATTRDTKLVDAEYVNNDDYVKQFNDNINELNANIAKNNISGIDYKVKELTPDGRLVFESPVAGSSGQTTTTWGVRIKPGKWQGTVEDIANKEYYRTIPGLEITNSLQGLFADGVARRGTGIYGSLNDYLKNLGMGRIKPGFNSQTKYSRGLWEDAVNKGKAFGFYGGKDVVYGAMKKLGGPINKNTKKQSNGGWIEQYK
jgi:hypothetical protein